MLNEYDIRTDMDVLCTSWLMVRRSFCAYAAVPTKCIWYALKTISLVTKRGVYTSIVAAAQHSSLFIQRAHLQVCSDKYIRRQPEASMSISLYALFLMYSSVCN